MDNKIEPFDLSKLQDEFTEAMHSEMKISDDKEKEIKVRLALAQISRGMDRTRVLKSYGLSESDLEKS